ncbi:MAG TPA: MarR family transcriptional regulator [Pseudogracilibacillus sp.]|nr:MarR family transcriptional regulator [Pseudogracilibacillus sp.]
MDKKALLDEIGDAIFDFSLAINEEFGGVYQDIPEKYRIVLVMLDRYESLYVKDLAALLHLSSSSVSQLLSKMEKEDYIERELDPEQRRQTFVTLGNEGRKIMQQMEKTRNDISSAYLMQLSEEDLKTFRDISIKIKKTVERKRETTI